MPNLMLVYDLKPFISFRFRGKVTYYLPLLATARVSELHGFDISWKSNRDVICPYKGRFDVLTNQLEPTIFGLTVT